MLRFRGPFVSEYEKAEAEAASVPTLGDLALRSSSSRSLQFDDFTNAINATFYNILSGFETIRTRINAVTAGIEQLRQDFVAKIDENVELVQNKTGEFFDNAKAQVTTWGMTAVYGLAGTVGALILGMCLGGFIRCYIQTRCLNKKKKPAARAGGYTQVSQT